MSASPSTRQARHERRRYQTKPEDLEDRINHACRIGPATMSDLRKSLKTARGFVEPAVLKMVAKGELLELDWIIPRYGVMKAYKAALTRVTR